MIIIRELKGRIEDRRDLELESLDIDYMYISSFDAVKNRYFGITNNNKELLINVDKGTYLSHKSVLLQNNKSLIYVLRRSEHSMIFECKAKEYIKRSNDFATIAHTLGNLHIPIEIDFPIIKAPITTSAEIVRRNIIKLKLEQIDIKEELIPLAKDKPLLGLKA